MVVSREFFVGASGATTTTIIIIVVVVAAAANAIAAAYDDGVVVVRCSSWCFHCCEQCTAIVNVYKNGNAKQTHTHTHTPNVIQNENSHETHVRYIQCENGNHFTAWTVARAPPPIAIAISTNVANTIIFWTMNIEQYTAFAFYLAASVFTFRVAHTMILSISYFHSRMHF